MTRAATLALAAAATMLVAAACDREDPVAPPAPRVAAGESLQAGPKGTEYPVPDSAAISKPAPEQHAKDSPANAPGDLTDKEERSQMPMAGQGHNYSGDARKAGQNEASPATSSGEKPAQ